MHASLYFLSGKGEDMLQLTFSKIHGEFGQVFIDGGGFSIEIYSQQSG